MRPALIAIVAQLALLASAHASGGSPPTGASAGSGAGSAAGSAAPTGPGPTRPAGDAKDTPQPTPGAAGNGAAAPDATGPDATGPAVPDGDHPTGPDDGAQGSDNPDGQDDGGDDGGTGLHEDQELGPVILIEGIEITGNTATSTEIIRRALPIAPGDILHSSDIRLRAARFKVLGLGYFRDVTLAMKKGSERGNVVIEIHVVERGTFVLNRLWFGSNRASPFWFGTDVGDRNLFGHGITIGGGAIYALHGDIAGSRDQWAGEVRIADGALRGTRWGVNGSLTVVHGSEAYQSSELGDQSSTGDFQAFHYRRIGGRAGVTYDASALSRFSGGLRIESIDAALPTAPTEILTTGQVTAVDLHLDPGTSRVVTASLGFDHDTRADPILPHSGHRITAAAEVGSSAIGGSYDFATVFAGFEQWWPLREERHAIGIRIAGGIVIGDAPRFDRIHISDVDHVLTPRALGLVLSTAPPFDVLGTRPDKPTYGTVGGTATVEYAARLFRGSGKNRVYGGDLFVGAGLWGLGDSADLRVRDSRIWTALPIDVYADAGVRIDTDIGIFELTIANALGRLR